MKDGEVFVLLTEEASVIESNIFLNHFLLPFF